MSVISEQVKALRIVGKSYSGWGLAKLLNGAADTIEDLSAKLAAANMERSTAYYNKAEVLEILDKMEFFNQRAARELWAEKTSHVQELDIESRRRDIEKLRRFVNQVEFSPGAIEIVKGGVENEG